MRHFDGSLLRSFLNFHILFFTVIGLFKGCNINPLYERLHHNIYFKNSQIRILIKTNIRQIKIMSNDDATVIYMALENVILVLYILWPSIRPQGEPYGLVVGGHDIRAPS